MEQYTENQYDDDLTDSGAEYDDSYYTGAEDLFDYTPDEESPISRLKNLVLSIDWEITDDVLMEFNEELVDLKDIWAGEKINLVYVQALEKLSKYIYQKKAESHPSAIKLLLTLYHNLEKIVTSDELTDSEKKSILLEDVKRFENLKTHLKSPDAKVTVAEPKPVVEEITPPDELDGDSELINLKAIVLGIDWEITDDDLSALRKEVVRLENLFAGSRPKLILLQGIGTIGAYIKVKKSDAHADAFKVLHLFYDSLERIVDSTMSVEEEKAILFPAVEKFNEFKALLGETISPDNIAKTSDSQDIHGEEQVGGAITPAFSDIPEDEVRGFQADEEAAALGIENPDKVNDHVANFFGEDSFVDEREPTQELADNLGEQFADTTESEVEFVDKKLALQGVDVEEGDEEEDESVPAALEEREEVAPALALDDEAPADASTESEIPEPVVEDVSTVDEKVKVTFPDGDDAESMTDFGTIDKNLALQGVDVESEADDDSDEEALPVLGGELAPALADNDETSIYNEETLGQPADADGLEDEIADTVLDFFADENPVEPPPSLAAESDELTANVSLDEEPRVTAPFPETEEDSPQEIAAEADEALSDEDFSTDIEGRLDDFFGTDDELAEDEPIAEPFTSMPVSSADSPVAALEETLGLPDDEEEEVVFELVEDADLPEEQVVVDNELYSEVVGDDLSVTEEKVDPVTSADDTSELSASDADIFAELEATIDAAGVELEDNVLQGLLQEVDKLDESFSKQPLEKTFTHLMRTVAVHIDRHRYEAGSDAYGLLQSVFGGLKESQANAEKKEELLMVQTVKVLNWQQEIIASDKSKDIDRSRLTEPLFVQELGNSDVLSAHDDSGLPEDTITSGEGNSLKDEISNLRKSLQDEISELKKGQ